MVPVPAWACSCARPMTSLASSTPQDDTGGRRVVRGYADRGFERVGRGGAKPAGSARHIPGRQAKNTNGCAVREE